MDLHSRLDVLARGQDTASARPRLFGHDARSDSLCGPIMAREAGWSPVAGGNAAEASPADAGDPLPSPLHFVGTCTGSWSEPDSWKSG